MSTSSSAAGGGTSGELRAVILAGGRGARLAPYTTILPKPLMPIGEIAILEVVLRQLAHYGFARATIAVGYLAELIMAYLGDGCRTGLTIDYSRESTPLGTAGPLKLIPDLNDTFLVINGDILTTLDFGALVRYHNKRRAAATIAVFKRAVKIDLGIIEMDSEHRLTGYREKPTLQYEVSMGVYVFHPDAMKYVRAGEPLDFPDLVKILLKEGELVVGYPYDGYWRDLGRKEDYEEAVEDFERMRDQFLPVAPPATV